MYLNLGHHRMDIYDVNRKFVCQCYKLVKSFPTEERFNMSQQIRRAALSVHLNLAEGASRKSGGERKRYYEVSRGSLVEIDAALDIAQDLEYLKNIDTKELGELLVRCFQVLTKMIENSNKV